MCKLDFGMFYKQFSMAMLAVDQENDIIESSVDDDFPKKKC